MVCMSECILYPEQCRVIYKVSFLSLGSSIYAMYNGHYILSLAPGVVFLTSIHYWKYPDYSYRRYLDMTCVGLALKYHLYKAYKSEYSIPYYSITFLAVSMYLLGVYYYKKKLFWHSTYAHCGLHILANTANVILYSGKIM